MASALVAVNAFSVSAQIVMFSTSGTFSGGTGGTICTAAQCTNGGFTLTFSGDQQAWLAALVDLGQCVTSYSPSGGTAGLTAFSGVGFVLQVVQTVPSGGVANISDGIAGNLAYNPSSSSLVWSPTVTSFSIGTANYKLVTDNTGNINIQAPTTADNPNATSVKEVSVTPEPATFLLLAPGLGLAVGGVRRRERAARGSNSGEYVTKTELLRGERP
jgi:hypothetical protein